MSDRVRNLVLTAVQGTLRITLSVLSRVVPQNRSVLVAAFPETEGNGVEVARALLRRYDGQVVWLQEGESPPEVLELAEQGMRLVPKAGLAGLVAYLRAEVVFFTHGLYGSPRPAPRKPLVNLWHGDGPKDSRPDATNRGAVIPSTYLVGSTRLFTGYKAEAFGIPPERVLLTGNPRTDQFTRRLDDTALERLGLTGDFVVWMPTFRSTKAVGAVRRWSEGGAADDGATLRPLLEGLRERGLQLVIKPHPMDADPRRWEGAVTVTNDDLARAGVTLYSLLGGSRGLVTDYSSVWTDYLVLDRPIAFLVGDRHTYARKLVPPDVLDWVPGELVDPDDQPFAQFLADLDGLVSSSERAQAAHRIGLNLTRTAADDLLSELERRGVLPLSPPPSA